MNKIIGYIYVIKSPNTNKIYIGSTSLELNERFKKHKSDAVNRKDACTSKLIFNFGDAYIEKLCEVKYINRSFLDKIEREYILENKDICVNKKFKITDEEYNEKKICFKCNNEFTRKNIWDHLRDPTNPCYLNQDKKNK